MLFAMSGSVMLSVSSVATAPGELIVLRMLYGFTPEPFGDHAHGMLGRRVDDAAGPRLMPDNRRHVDNVAALLGLHLRKCGRDTEKDAFELHIDHAFPVGDLQSLEGRIRHEARVVEKHVDLATRFHGMIDQRLHLAGTRHVDFHRCVRAKTELLREPFEALDAPRAKGELRAVLCEAPPSGEEQNLVFVLLVGHLFHPVHRLSVEGLGNR
jgi:hypothetical protein